MSPRRLIPGLISVSMLLLVAQPGHAQVSIVDPVIVISLRDQLDTVQRNSTLDFTKYTFWDVGGIIERDARLIYSDPRQGFELPIIKYIGFARFIGRPGRDGQIYSIAFAPHRGVVSTEDAWRLIVDLSAKLETAGWQPDPLFLESHLRFRSFEDFEKWSTNSRFEPGMRTNVRYWRGKTDVARLSVVKVIHLTKPEIPSQRFNVVVDIEEGRSR